MAITNALVLDQERSLTAALMVMLNSEGLRIPGLDPFSGRERFAAIPLGIPELLLLNALRRGGRPLSEVVREVAAESQADEEHLRDVVGKLWERGLLIEGAGAGDEEDESDESIEEVAIGGESSEWTGQLLMKTPRLFRMRGRKYEALDHEGRVLLSLGGVELAAASEFRQPMSKEQWHAKHLETCRGKGLDERAFEELVRRLGAAELLERTGFDTDYFSEHDGPVMRKGRPRWGRERANDQEWQRFQKLNSLVRESVREFEAAEYERERRSGRKRVRVVPVQQNGTVFPLAMGMIVAYAKAHEGGRLNEHYAFHPDWLVRTSKVRSLTESPGIFLFSNYNWSHRHNMLISKKVKQLSPWSVTIHGGPNTPKYEVDSEVYFRDNPDVDITVRGEGEAAVAELLSALVGAVGEGPVDLSILEGMLGITYRDGERIVRTPERPRIVDLDSIPSPILSNMFLPYQGTPLGIIETNRGCPYSCTFCDWGSAIATKVRKFSIERVFAEFEWCAQHQVAGIMVADANFGMYERDVDIAERVAALKKEYGYPNGFSVSAAKNTTKYTKRIIEILAEAGVMSKGSIGVQSTDPTTLSAIKRSNIKLEAYDEIANEFRKSKLPLWVDFMFGLPGQTITSFQNDLQGCVNRGVFPRIFMTELLINSPMNEPSYRAEHQIKTELSPDGFKQLVVSTSTFSRQDYEEMNGLLQLFVLCDVIGVLRQVAHYVRSETGMREIDFYEQLRRDIREDTERWPVLAFSVRALPSLLLPPASWGLVMEEARRYLIEVLRLEDNDAMRTVFKVQLALLPARDRMLPETLKLSHDYASWHRAMVRATHSGHRDDWPDVVPKLREFGPALFTVDDPYQLCALGIGAAVDGDLFGNYELGSPVARWTSSIDSTRLDEATANVA